MARVEEKQPELMAQEPQQVRRYRFPPRMRIRRTRDFQRIFASGRRAADSHLTVWALRNNLGFTRLGIIVGHQHGIAVRRNRLRRLVREAFRLSQHRLPQGLDLLVSPRAGKRPTLSDLIDSLSRLAARLERQFPPVDTPP